MNNSGRKIFPAADRSVRLADMSREEWLLARWTGIGGSDAAAILGMNPWSSPYDVWLDKTGRAEPKEVNLAMMIGNELEEAVARLWCSETGKQCHRSGFMFSNNENSWQLANVDRMVNGENAGLECKTTSSLSNIRKLKSGDFPDTYYAQCVHYLAVTGADRWYLAILELGTSPKFHSFVLERDEAEIELLTKTERDFWECHVLKGEPPAPSGTEATDEYIKKEYPKAENDEPVGLYGMENDIETYLLLKNRIKTEQKSADALEQKIKLQLGKASTGLANGYTVTWKTVTRAGGVDAEKLAANYPAALAACKKADISYRNFNIKEEKK